MTAHRLVAGSVLALALLAAACAGTPERSPPPAWLSRADADPRCGDAMLCATGSAPGTDAAALDSARRRALQEIAASIHVDVQAEIVTATRSLLTDAQAAWSEEFAEDIRLRTNAELPAAEVLDTHVDAARDETSVLVAVPRLALVDKWLPQLEAAVGRADELVQQATRVEGDDPARALQLLAAAQQAVAEEWVLANKLRVVANRTSAAARVVGPWNRISQLFATLSAELTRVAGGLRLQVVSGDGQRGRVRGFLPAPLVVQAQRRDADGTWQPLPDLPLRALTPAPGMAELHPSAGLTDADGRLRLQAGDLRRAPGAPSAIHVLPDVGSEPVPGLPEAVFHYSLPTASDTRLVLVGRATLDGDPLPGDTLAASLAAHLGAAGFDAESVPRDEPRHAELLAAPPTRLAALVPRDVDYVLRAHAPLQRSSRSGGLHWFTGAGRVELVALDDGSVLTLGTDPLKGAHTSSDAEGARRVLVRELLPALTRALDEQFVGDFLPHDAGAD